MLIILLNFFLLVLSLNLSNYDKNNYIFEENKDKYIYKIKIKQKKHINTYPLVVYDEF